METVGWTDGDDDGGDRPAERRRHLQRDDVREVMRPADYLNDPRWNREPNMDGYQDRLQSDDGAHPAQGGSFGICEDCERHVRIPNGDTSSCPRCRQNEGRLRVLAVTQQQLVLCSSGGPQVWKVSSPSQCYTAEHKRVVGGYLRECESLRLRPGRWLSHRCGRCGQRRVGGVESGVCPWCDSRSAAVVGGGGEGGEGGNDREGETGGICLEEGGVVCTYTVINNIILNQSGSRERQRE
uniref:Uncharacterized protein n=1 Tax=Chromera velia CCMP2878 TaxID=1169474 RepID=A0A0G4HJ19_9ALVE|eukprot:Cvel_27999.t1-p1 / transcript=Cvel_27999.t1 / gene=Cvel_27999 / organism=Chromera_velia_CCMP2878 / gene_product=hypothetical protein / transcript_product=hypothetical protein / location=Cvel_scaffold3588:14618-15404(+) / protein_length=238 / sequence_SO=supercontig / SO=protein_coding / is_pseudo=false